MDTNPFDKISYLAQRAEMHIYRGMPAAALSDIMAAEMLCKRHGLEFREWDNFVRQQAYYMEVLEEFYELLAAYHATADDPFDDSDLFELFYMFKDTLDDLEGIIEIPAELKELNLVFDFVRAKGSNRYERELVSNQVEDIYVFARAEAWFMSQSWYNDYMQRLGWDNSGFSKP